MAWKEAASASEGTTATISSWPSILTNWATGLILAFRERAFTDMFADSNDGGAWADQWTLSTDGASVPTMQSEAGQMPLNGASTASRATAEHNDITNAEVVLDVTPSSYDGTNIKTLSTVLRGNGTWDGTELDAHVTCYRAELLVNAGATLQLHKVVNGTVTALGSAQSLTGTPTTWRIRFRVDGTAIKAKAWDASGAEPGTWDIEQTDSSVSAGGVLAVAAKQDAGAATTHTMTVDRVLLEELAATEDVAKLIGRSVDIDAETRLVTIESGV